MALSMVLTDIYPGYVGRISGYIRRHYQDIHKFSPTRLTDFESEGVSWPMKEKEDDL